MASCTLQLGHELIQYSMKRSAGLISLVYGLTTGIQIFGQIVVARLFGANVTLDAFVSAVTIPTLLTSVIAGTLNNALLPQLKKHQLSSEEKGNIYYFRLMILLSGIVLVASIVLDIFSVPVVTMLVGARGESFVLLTDNLMRMMIYTMPFTLVGTFCNSYLYSKKQFVIPSIAFLIGSILNLGIIILFSPQLGIWSMVVAFIAAIIFQLAITFPYKAVSYLSASFGSIWSTQSFGDMKILLRAWVPLIISTLALRFDGILTRSFSASLPEGYIVYTNLVSKLFSGLVGIVMIGIQTVTFPHIVELIHKKEIRRAISQVRKAKLYAFLLSIVTILIILFVSPFFMRLLLTGGKFTQSNVEMLISLFPYFILPALAWGTDSLFTQPITAIGKQHLMTVINICAVFLAWVSATIANNMYGGMVAISVALIVLSFTGIIGAEILWRIESKKLLQTHK